jgi:hypothetical protein
MYNVFNAAPESSAGADEFRSCVESLARKKETSGPHRDHSNDRCDDVCPVFLVLFSINVLPGLGLKIKPPISARPDQIAERQRVTISRERDGKAFLDGQPAPGQSSPSKSRSVRALRASIMRRDQVF